MTVMSLVGFSGVTVYLHSRIRAVGFAGLTVIVILMMSCQNGVSQPIASDR
jgi:hypothetical protein